MLPRFTGWLLPAWLIFSTFGALAGGGNDKTGGSSGEHDTTQAIVLYGHNFLFDPLRFNSDGELIDYLDSLLEQPEISIRLIDEINLFMNVRKLSETEIQHMVDSLFGLTHIPYALINQINYFTATRNLPLNYRLRQPRTITAWYQGTLGFKPDFYEAWDTQHAHPLYNPANDPDTAVTLVLSDTLRYCGYHHPFKGKVTSSFGWRDGRPHNGIDVDLVTGDPVVSAFDGIVRVAGRRGGYGNLVVVRHHNGLETYYAHLHRIRVKTGQSVSGGQLIGTGGNTGNSSGSHLHFEVRFRGKPINPKHLISFNEYRLHSEAIVITRSRSRYNAFPEGTEFHTVVRGESLSAIAGRYGITITRLCELNGLSRRSIIKPGQKIRVS